MAWFSVEDTAADHPKIKRLARLEGCGQHEALGRLVALWCWVVRYAPDGNLVAFANADITDACGLTPGHLVDCGLLDDADDGLVVHGWLERRSNYREATTRAERRRTEALRATVRGQSADKTRTSGGQDADCPRTVPQRGEERRGEERKGEERRDPEIGMGVWGGTAAEPGNAPSANASEQPGSEVSQAVTPKPKPKPRRRPPPEPDTTPVVLTILGEPITERRVGEYTAAYPGLDVVAEVRRATIWLDDNPHKRDKIKSPRQYLSNWLRRAHGDLPPASRVVTAIDGPAAKVARWIAEDTDEQIVRRNVWSDGIDAATRKRLIDAQCAARERINWGGGRVSEAAHG